MLNIVFEGPDHAGKSTLAKTVSDALRMPLQISSGVPKSYPEICERTQHYIDNLNGYVIDRHPCVSQVIYGELRNDPPLPQHMVDAFYAQKPFLIYCCANVDLSKHVPSVGDTPEHLAALETGFQLVVRAYEAWAFEHAHIFYRNYDETERIIAMMKGLILNEYRRH